MRENEPGTHGRYPTDSQSDSSQSPPTKKKQSQLAPRSTKNINKAKGYCEQRAENTAEHTGASGEKINPLLCILRSSLFRPEKN